MKQKEDQNIKQEDELLKGNDEVAASIEDPEVEHIFEKLEPDEQELIGTMISYSGPLPPPNYLKGYVEVYPEAAERIFQWV